MKVLDLANYIIFKANEYKIELDPLKLQKLLYYIQGYSLKEFNTPAFEEEIVHWDCGPIVPIVYRNYSGNTNSLILSEDKMIIEPSFTLKRIIDTIIQISDNYTSKDLENMTQLEASWLETKQNEVISKETLKKHFTKNNPLNLNLEKSILEDDNEYKKFSDQILSRNKAIFKALS